MARGGWGGQGWSGWPGVVGVARIKFLPLLPFIIHSPLFSPFSHLFPSPSPPPNFLFQAILQARLHNVGGSTMSVGLQRRWLCNVDGSLQRLWLSTTSVALQCPWFYNIRGSTTSPPKHFNSGKGFKVEYRFNGFRVRLRFMVRFRFKVRLTAMVKFG